eukprot:TRINITY_DN2877_c0_g1_i1.p1 TRINITY_DN2877_c0_g1~~TRINITY_DN2877_c0_g1_i1.p1  ORF type:complete len:399 (-),score=131.01 TRINITY_DN2877_c0_g1_i1:86-1255(-)
MEETKQERLVASCEISDIKVVEDGPKGLQSFVTYHIRSEFSNGTQHLCVRRYSDFEWLQKRLEQDHKDVIVPPIPDKDAFFRFSPEVVHFRRRQFGRFLDRLIVHPVFGDAKTLEVFLTATEEQLASHKAASKTADEPASEQKEQQQVGAAAASAFFSMLNTVSNIATNLTTEVQEVDSSFTDKKVYLELLREKLGQTLNATENYIQKNTDYVDQTVGITKEIEAFESFERANYPEISEAFSKFRDIELGVVEVLDRRSKNEREMFEDPLRDHVAWTVAAERLLDNRARALKAYQLAQAATKAKQEKVDAGQGGETLALELQKAKDQEAELGAAFETISINVKKQLEEYQNDKSKALRLALRELARENIEYGEQTIALWKDLGKSLQAK